jgi:F-type H+-transporting ATPase subunit a
MRRFYFFSLLLIAALLACGGLATARSAEPAHEATTEEHHLPLKATPLYYGIGGHPPTDPQHPETARIGFLAVTNSMIVTWIVAAGILFCARLATRKIQSVPAGLQNFWEWLVESLHNFLESMIGRDLVKRTFWFFATIFIFILFVNWFGLIPGVGTIGFGHYLTNGAFHLDRPLLRGGNADLNMTSAMAMMFFVCWTVWAIQANGVGGFLVHIFGPKGESKGLMKIAMVGIFFAVGLLEVVSILFRPISLSFRLFGNVYAGETILESMSNMVPSLSWLLPIPFYFMELLVGLVQAMVFMLLTAVFTLLIAQHEPGHEAHH